MKTKPGTVESVRFDRQSAAGSNAGEHRFVRSSTSACPGCKVGRLSRSIHERAQRRSRRRSNIAGHGDIHHLDFKSLLSLLNQGQWFLPSSPSPPANAEWTRVTRTKERSRSWASFIVITWFDSSRVSDGWRGENEYEAKRRSCRQMVRNTWNGWNTCTQSMFGASCPDPISTGRNKSRNRHVAKSGGILLILQRRINMSMTKPWTDGGWNQVWQTLNFG